MSYLDAIHQLPIDASVLEFNEYIRDLIKLDDDETLYSSIVEAANSASALPSEYTRETYLSLFSVLAQRDVTKVRNERYLLARRVVAFAPDEQASIAMEFSKFVPLINKKDGTDSTVLLFDHLQNIKPELRLAEYYACLERSA